MTEEQAGVPVTRNLSTPELRKWWNHVDRIAAKAPRRHDEPTEGVPEYVPTDPSPVRLSGGAN